MPIDDAPGTRLETGTLDRLAVVRRLDGLVSADVPGGRVLVGPSGAPITLSASAAAILDAIDGRRRICDLAEPVAEQFHVDVDTVDEVVLATVRRFGAIGLLANVRAATVDVAPPPVEPPDEPAQRLDAPETLEVLRQENSCVAERFDLERATLHYLRTPLFDMGVGTSGAAAADLVRSLLGTFRTEAPLPLGLMVVAPDPADAFIEPLFTIFDGSGYRAWRGRSRDEVASYLLGLLSPIEADAEHRRCFLDLRPVARGGEVVLVHPYVLDDVRVMVECGRRGWEPKPSLCTEVDLETGSVVVRGPFDPSSPATPPPVTSRLRVVGIHYGVSLQPPEPTYALEALARRHLQLADGQPLRDSIGALAAAVSEVPVAVAAEPSGRAYLESFRRLVTQIEGETP